MMSNISQMDKRIDKIFGTAKETPESIAMLESAMSSGSEALAPQYLLDIKVPTDTNNTRKEVK